MSRRLMLIAVTSAVLLGAAAGGVHAQSAAPATGERFILSGVLFVENGGGLAWLQEPALTNNEVVTVRPGDSIGPYRVTKILEDQVEMEGPRGKFSIPVSGPHVMAARSQEPRPQAPAVEGPRRDSAPPRTIFIPKGDLGFPTEALFGRSFASPPTGAWSQEPRAQDPASRFASDVSGSLQAPVVEEPQRYGLPPHATFIPKSDLRFPAGVLFGH